MNALADQLEERAASTDVARQSKEETVLQAIERQGTEIARALPTGMTAERFTRIVVTAVKQTPQLQTCSASSLLGAVMLSAQLGLEPGPLGHAYLVPFKNQVTFIVGYKGLIDLAMRSGKIESIVARDVRANDKFDYELGTDERIVHKPALGDRGDTIAYYAVARLVGGGRIMHVMSRTDIERHRKRSSAKNSGPWVTDYDAMARKTVIRVMSPYLPMSIDAARAIANDDVIVTSLDSDLADRTPAPRPDVIDVEGHEIDPDDDRPRGAGMPPAGAAEGGEVDGEERAPTRGEAPDPSATTVTKDAGAGAADAASPKPSDQSTPTPATKNAGAGPVDVESVSDDRPDPPVETVNDEGAQAIGMWCADAGINDALRPAFLWAFSGGEYRSAHDVPTDVLRDLRQTLGLVKRGELVLQVDPTGECGPELVLPGERAADPVARAEPAPAEITWRALLGEVKGIGSAKVLRRARDLAGERGLELPKSIDEIPAALNEPLRAWLAEQVAA